jgi:ATP-dependent protease Clp ATPase subunit
VRFRRPEGVIFLDEIDKWCLFALSRGLDKPDPELVSMGTNKQAELLTYVEREDVWFTEEAKDLGALREADGEAVGEDAEEVAWKPVVFETRRTFWVMAGAFDGLHHLVRRRLQQDHLADERDLWEKVSPDDLKRYGMQPELVNRCDVVVWAKPLKGHQMIEILLQQDVPRYVRMFEVLGCKLDLQVSALALACELAVQERTGARGASLRLKHVMSELFTEADTYELTSCTVDAFVMQNGHFSKPMTVSPQIDGQPSGQTEPTSPGSGPVAAVAALSQAPA